MSGGTNYDLAPTIPLDGEPHHVVHTYDSSTGVQTVYIDGVQAAQGTGRSGMPNSGSDTDSFHIGTDPNGNDYDWEIAHVALYDVALSVTTVEDHYDAGVGGPSLIDQAGTLSTAGGLLKRGLLSRGGAATPAGAIKRSPARTVAGTLTPAGAVAVLKSKLLSLAGALTPTATVRRTVARRLTATLTPAGLLDLITTTRVVSGVLATAATLRKSSMRALAGALTQAGALVVETSTAPPVITDVQVTPLTPTSVEVQWETDILADGQVAYDTTGHFEGDPELAFASYSNHTPVDPDKVLSHSITITDLPPGSETVWHFRVRSDTA